MPRAFSTIFRIFESLLLIFSVVYMTLNMATKPSNHNLNGALVSSCYSHGEMHGVFEAFDFP